jgi:hypothetical protein
VANAAEWQMAFFSKLLKQRDWTRWRTKTKVAWTVT